MKSKKCFLYLSIVFMIGLISYSLQREKKRSSFLNLLNVETLSYAENIDYSVPDMSNDPKQCTIEIWIGAGVEGNTGSGYYKKEKGIVNTCRTGDSGCDPYNCHQRVK